MDFTILRTAFELLYYVRMQMDDPNIGVRKLHSLEFLYDFLNDFITVNLSKEKGEYSNVYGTKKQRFNCNFENCR